jgi:hypothetical protein
MGCLLVIFASFDMLRDRAVERKGKSTLAPAALLHQQPTLRCDQEGMNTSVQETKLVDDGSHLLRDDRVNIIDNIEKFVWHMNTLVLSE